METEFQGPAFWRRVERHARATLLLDQVCDHFVKWRRAGLWGNLPVKNKNCERQDPHGRPSKRLDSSAGYSQKTDRQFTIGRNSIVDRHVRVRNLCGAEKTVFQATFSRQQRAMAPLSTIDNKSNLISFRARRALKARLSNRSVRGQSRA